MSQSLNTVAQCRLSGESLADSDLVFELTDCPVPGIYPTSRDVSAEFRTPLKVVQARVSGFVQLAHEFDSALYEEYAFAGGGSAAYRQHLEEFASQIRAHFPLDAAILEVGCGDGWLLKRLRELGFKNVLGIDPSRAAKDQEAEYLIRGYFPADLPPSHRNKKFDLIFSRHVLEHVERPRAFVAAMVQHLSKSGQIWIEVPDLKAAVDRQLWTNFYQLHCNYFNAITLDNLMSMEQLGCIWGTNVDVFGGSILRRYVLSRDVQAKSPERLMGSANQVVHFKNKLSALVRSAPFGCSGYGAAERTAVTFGFCPALSSVVEKIYDGNPLLSGRYLAGTRIAIHHRERLYEDRPHALLLFALSNVREIVSDLKLHMPMSTKVAVVGQDDEFKCLGDLS